MNNETPSPASRKATRADVARLAGVSSALVSYVVNDVPKVAPETRKRVLEAIDLLGYRPNLAARALSRGRTDMLGMVVPDSRNPYFAELVAAVEDAANTQGRTLLTINSHSLPPSSRLLGLRAQQLDGLIVADTLDESELSEIADLDIPVVLINQFRPSHGFSSIGVDHRDGARQAVEHLIDLGHRRIAFIGGSPGVDERERGWSDALTRAGLPLGPSWHVGFTLEGGYGAGLELARDDSGVTAVFIASDQLSIAALAAFGENGIRVPEDLAVASFDGTHPARYARPALTTMVQPLGDMAREAVRRVLGPVDDEGFVAYSTTLLIRASTVGATPPQGR